MQPGFYSGPWRNAASRRRYRTMRRMVPCRSRRRLVRALALLAAAPAASFGAGGDPVEPEDGEAAPGSNTPSRRPNAGAPARPDQGGLASITRDRLEGFKTASGEPYSRNGMTAAHRNLPFGTLVRVTNLDNRRSVIVRINDRSSAIGARIIDLTPRAAAIIGLQGIDTVRVKVEVIGASGVRVTAPAVDPDVK